MKSCFFGRRIFVVGVILCLLKSDMLPCICDTFTWSYMYLNMLVCTGAEVLCWNMWRIASVREE